MVIVMCSMLAPTTIVVITQTKHNMKIPLMVHHVQTQSGYSPTMKIKIQA
jgi:hypothetical protein